MLPKEKRVRKTSEFKRIFSDGQVLFSDVFIFKYIPTQASTTRFGIVISTKVSKRSVKRNRLKRQISAILSEMMDILVPGYDVVVMVKKDVGHTFTYSELKKQLVYLVKKAQLVKKEKKHA